MIAADPAPRRASLRSSPRSRRSRAVDRRQRRGGGARAGARRCSWRRWPASRPRRPARSSRCRPAPRPSGSRTTCAQFLGADEVELFPAWETLPFERVSPVARDDGPAPAGDVAPARPAASACPRSSWRPVRALVQRLGPARRGRRAGRRAAGRPASTATSSSTGSSRSATGASTRSRRAARSRCAARSSTSTRRPPTTRCASTSGATRSTGCRQFSVADQRSHRTTSTEVRDLPGAASCCPPTRCARAPRALVAQRAVGPRAVGAAGRGPEFDGMESWLPWLTDDEHLLPDLLPDDALVAAASSRAACATAPRSCSTRRRAGRDARGHVGRARRATTARACRSPFDRLLAHTGAGAASMLATPDEPDTPRARRERVRSRGRRRRRARRAGCARSRATGYRVVLAAEGTGSAQRLRDVLAGEGVDARSGDRRPARSASSSRRSSAASCCPARKLALRRRSRPHRPPARAPHARAARAAAPDYYDGLEPGDYVVHHLHGVGRYVGMVKRDDGRRRARLPARSSSRAATSVYVATDQIGLDPQVHRRRDAEALERWAAPTGRRRKARVRSAVREIAAGARRALPAAARDARPRVRARHAVAARDRGGVPVRGDARPAARRSTR